MQGATLYPLYLRGRRAESGQSPGWDSLPCGFQALLATVCTVITVLSTEAFRQEGCEGPLWNTAAGVQGDPEGPHTNAHFEELASQYQAPWAKEWWAALLTPSIQSEYPSCTLSIWNKPCAGLDCQGQGPFQDCPQIYSSQNQR